MFVQQLKITSLHRNKTAIQFNYEASKLMVLLEDVEVAFETHVKTPNCESVEVRQLWWSCLGNWMRFWDKLEYFCNKNTSPSASLCFSFLSYHYVYRWQASQKAVWSQKRGHKWVPRNRRGGWANKCQALRPQGLKALWVIHVSFTIWCGGVSWCPVGFTGLGCPLWWRQGSCGT